MNERCCFFACAKMLSARRLLPRTAWQPLLLEDFTISRWSRRNPSANVQRTATGRSTINSELIPVANVASSHYSAKRGALSKAFRLYRDGVGRPSDARKQGEAVAASVHLNDLGFGTGEVDFPFLCLYLNACHAFGQTATLDSLWPAVAGALASADVGEIPVHCIEALLAASVAMGGGNTVMSLLLSRVAPIATELKLRRSALLILLAIAASDEGIVEAAESASLSAALAEFVVRISDSSCSVEELDALVRVVNRLCPAPTHTRGSPSSGEVATGSAIRTISAASKPFQFSEEHSHLTVLLPKVHAGVAQIASLGPMDAAVARWVFATKAIAAVSDSSAPPLEAANVLVGRLLESFDLLSPGQLLQCWYAAVCVTPPKIHVERSNDLVAAIGEKFADWTTITAWTDAVDSLAAEVGEAEAQLVWQRVQRPLSDSFPHLAPLLQSSL